MKSFIFFLYSLLHVSIASAQRQKIDVNVITSWPNLNNYGISNDGKFVWYVVDSGSIGSTLFIRETNGKRKASYNRCSRAIFSNDSRNILFANDKGIYRIDLNTFKASFIKDATGLMVSENSNWLSYYKDRRLKLVNLSDGLEFSFGETLERWFAPTGRHFLIKYKDSLTLFNLTTTRGKTIFSGVGVEGACFNQSGNQLLFSVIVDGNAYIYNHSLSTDNTKLIISNSSPGMRRGTLLSGQGMSFNNTGDCVLFKYKITEQQQERDSNLITESVDIWNYQDTFLQSQQVLEKSNRTGRFDPEHLYQGVKPTSGNGEVFLLENADTTIHLLIGNQYAILKSVTNDDEGYWKDNAWPSFELVSFKNGRRTDFLSSKRHVGRVALSPSERFITWTDADYKKYYCYNVATKRTITLPALGDSSSNFDVSEIFIAGWLKEDSFIICHDEYDLWQIDPFGQKAPICLTAGLGHSQKIAFSLIEDQGCLVNREISDKLVVAAIDDSTKDNGFYEIKLSSSRHPQKLLSGPFLYYFPGLFADNSPKRPLKAKNANVYLIKRQSDTEFPNLIFTKNFIQQTVLTDIHPERGFNWPKAQIIHWSTTAGDAATGILYVPKDLDTTKRYPIIFNYYESRSGELRRYHRPELSAVNINIPVYIDKGYLIFVPDIPRIKGHTFENALDIIESGALYLTKKYRWIDKSNMGLQGQSFGGTVTNYVATHSALFAAAQASAGRADFISCYGGTGFGGKSLQGAVEVFQNKLGYTPWERPDVYINNSAIFGAGTCSTPLLLAHGTDDAAVNIGQSIELFTALRRAGKTVWLLQYNAGHVFFPYGDVGRDFIKRQEQFFDHYLKGAPMPVWMSEGVPAKFKGVRSGFALDKDNLNP